MKKLLFALGCLIAFQLKAQNADSIKITLENMGSTVNSTFADYGPATSADGLLMMFTSRRPVIIKQKDNKEQNESVYFTAFDNSKNAWGPALRLGEVTNVPGRNNSIIALSNDGQRMLLYRDAENGNGDIYESTLKGNEWVEATSIGEPINSEFHESSASISHDGRTIYFVSDRPGGIGGRDIWYASKDANGNWGQAKNLGSVVNSVNDEEGVFIHPDGKTLYFSSKGHNSIGGYDIFKTELSGLSWISPLSLGAPVNTIGDDIYFVMEANGKTGYYSSSNAGGIGEKDIYKIIFTPVKKSIAGPRMILLKGIIGDVDSGNPLAADIEIIDNARNEVLSTFTSNSSTGKYLVSLPAGKNYGINVSSAGYLFHSENFNLIDSVTYTEISKNIMLKKLEVGNKIVLNNIFYEFNKASLGVESAGELERVVKLLKENPSMKIEISSHTDNIGSDDYNLKLSQARAQSVVDYLMGKGISKDHVIAKGYGEAQPIAENESETGRQKNRRTEFIVLRK